MAIGVDFSAVQVRLARARYPDVQFEQADAQALPFGAESFDAVVSGFGMCHFARPELALREAFRVLKREGRLAFTVWDMPESAVAFGVLYAAIHAHGAMDVGLPAGPDYFLFSDAERSAQALSSAGFVSASCRRVPQLWRVSDPDEVFEVLCNATVRAGAALRQQGPRARDAIRAALRNAIAAYRCGESYHVPMPAMLSAAVKPG
jgi:SAM-dependent methyltransferase